MSSSINSVNYCETCGVMFSGFKYCDASDSTDYVMLQVTSPACSAL